MKQRRIPALFLFAAAPIFAATSAFADTTDITVYDLDGNYNYSDTNLTVIQNTDGELSGTLSGSGSFVKKGAANLTLNNTISLASGTITAEEGSLTTKARLCSRKATEIPRRSNSSRFPTPKWSAPWSTTARERQRSALLKATNCA